MIRSGFTLVELTLAMMMGMIVSSLVLALFNLQLSFLGIYRKQNFLTEEAPLINTYVSRLVSGADRFRLHPTLADAAAGSNARMVASPVMVLNFRQPDGTSRAAIMSFETRNTIRGLYYYVVPQAGPLGAPQWAITERVNDVSFSVENGVMRMKITGPENEVITYSGAMQQ